jgi:murein DD-endopeptidase MepM/ murein hydrolase activator NlpD
MGVVHSGDLMPLSPSSYPPERPGTAGRRERHLVLGRGVVLTLGAGAAALGIWAGAATWFILARDDFGQGVFARQAELEYGYEDRIKSLQNQLERAVTQNLVERAGFAARVDGLAKRQAEIEGRQNWLKQLAGRVPMPAGTPVPIASAPGTALAAPKLAPSPEPFALRLGDTPTAQSEAEPRPRDRLSAVESSIEGVAADEIRLIEGLRWTAQRRLSRVTAIVGSTGLDVDRLGAAAGTGGPLVPLPTAARAGAFGPLAAELEATMGELDRVLGLSRTLPLARPLVGELEATSQFGYRVDPFTRGVALHTGVDLRAESGSAVRATAAGKVTVAEYTGGYGNMIEVDHGGGITTRYGHLAGYAVAPGERVESGEMIGRAGSTGRSTGSHLHYEVRINGEPINPTRFLGAGAQLAAAMAQTD